MKLLPNLLGQLLLAGLLLSRPAAIKSQASDDYKRAWVFFQQQDFASAAPLFEQVENSDPGRTDALLLAAKARVNIQQYATADSHLRKYLESNPRSSDAWYLLGFVLNRENKARESLDVYTKAASLSAPTGDDLKIVALDYELLNDNADAIHWLEIALEKDSANAEAWYYLGRAYYTASRLPAARKAFERMLELDPQNARAENNIGLIFESGGQSDEALAAYRNAIAWQKPDSPSREQPYLNLGSLLTTLDRAQDAIAPLRQATAIAPNDSQGHLRLGTAYLHLNQLSEAERELGEAVRLAPNDPAAHYQLGRCYKQAGKMAAAKTEFDRVSEIQSQTVEKLKSPQR
jgi:tetratricopeptide (TPR) repeat protein